MKLSGGSGLARDDRRVARYRFPESQIGSDPVGFADSWKITWKLNAESPSLIRQYSQVPSARCITKRRIAAETSLAMISAGGLLLEIEMSASFGQSNHVLELHVAIEFDRLGRG